MGCHFEGNNGFRKYGLFMDWFDVHTHKPDCTFTTIPAWMKTSVRLSTSNTAVLTGISPSSRKVYG